MKLTLFSIILIAFITGHAQSVEIPNKEFSLSIATEALTVARGENKKMEIRILRSKAYRKSKMSMGLSSTLPSGINISFDPDHGDADIVQATITALPDALPGLYSIIVNATINYKTKGSILKISVQ